MPIFSYRAKKSSGKIVTGELVATNQEFVRSQLQNQGLTLLSTANRSQKSGGLETWLQKFRRVPLVQKAFFTQNLAVMLRGGFSIGRAMGVLAVQTTNVYFRHIILELQDSLEGGTSFAVALKKYPQVFSTMFVNMIAAGEVSGKLDEVLGVLTKQMKKDHQLTSKVKGALTYPVVVVIAMVGVAIAMLTFVIPKLLEVFSQNNAQLPLPTRILIYLSNSLQHQGGWMALGCIILLMAGWWFSKTPRGNKYFDLILLRLPIFGAIRKKINLARFTRSLSSLLLTDIPIIQTFHIISGTLGSYAYQQSMTHAAEALRSGASVGKVLDDYPTLYPPLVQQMISVGEESGTLDQVSAELSSFYEEEVDQTMSNLSTIIEPILLLFLGAGVAAMAIAILLPMYSLSEQIN